ncbi:hypothetical protein SAMN04487997_3225 [Frateuria terrea]|uniref:Uncharacterized protein n=1 Tax=Frateuria terrea TaxID=529704 RepID=A0A1H6YUA7_9GAMM|nr:hypothetical protein SAMN04487997_3225 [Frateuria terrea]
MHSLGGVHGTPLSDRGLCDQPRTSPQRHGSPAAQPQPQADRLAGAAWQPQVQAVPAQLGQWQAKVLAEWFMGTSSMGLAGIRTSIRAAIVGTTPGERLNQTANLRLPCRGDPP